MMLDASSDKMRPGPREGLRWIGAEELSSLVDIETAMRSVDAAMRMLSSGEIIAPKRRSMSVSDVGSMGLMPGAAPYLSRFGVRILNLFDPAARGTRPSQQGVMLLGDLRDGRPLCAVDGAALTALRAAASSAVASRALARPDARSLAIIGCGDQARLHVKALRAIFPIRSVTVWNRTRAKAEAFARAHLSDLAWEIGRTPACAVESADIVCTLTSSDTPILAGKNIRPGQHFNLIGSSIAGPREVDSNFVARVRYAVDSRDHALSEAAELLEAIDAGIVGSGHIAGEIGDILSGRAVGRSSPNDITAFRSLGHVVQDIAVAEAAYVAARSRDGAEA